jgi:Flp pilus assembly protein TadG
MNVLQTGRTMKCKSERGQSLVELGISLLILLWLLAGAAEFGILFFQFVQLRDAAQEGALFGSMNPTSTSWANIEARARGASASPINLADPTKVDVSIFVDGTLVWKNGAAQGSTTVACEGHGIQVTVDFKHQVFMPFMPQILNRSEIPLSATVVDTILTPICP